MTDTQQQIIDELTVSYWMEIETITNYLANSTNLTGIRAEEVKKSLAADVTEELSHAKMLADRIHVLGGSVPGSAAFKPSQTSLQPPSDARDVVAVIKGVIEAEEGAMAQYKKIIKLASEDDPVTEDLCITLLADEESHRREFLGFLTEYESA